MKYHAILSNNGFLASVTSDDGMNAMLDLGKRVFITELSEESRETAPASTDALCECVRTLRRLHELGIRVDTVSMPGCLVAEFDSKTLEHFVPYQPLDKE